MKLGCAGSKKHPEDKEGQGQRGVEFSLVDSIKGSAQLTFPGNLSINKPISIRALAVWRLGNMGFECLSHPEERHTLIFSSWLPVWSYGVRGSLQQGICRSCTAPPGGRTGVNGIAVSRIVQSAPPAGFYTMRLCWPKLLDLLS